MTPTFGASSPGRPIVLLPGMDGTGELSEGFARSLAQSRPVYAVKYPEQDALGYAGLLQFVRSRLPPEPFVILGESFSGPIAIELAATLPRVSGLILASSFARRPVPTILSPFAKTIDPRWLPQSAINAALFGATGTPDQRSQIHRVLARLGRNVLLVRAADVVAVDKLAQLAKVTCPILYLRGNRDRLIPCRCLDEILQAQPRAQVCRLDAAHMLLCTHGEAAAFRIEHFYRALRDAAAP